jgi:hypothetical protein
MKTRKLGIVILFAGAAVATFVFTALGSQQHQPQPARPGDPTYELSSFAVNQSSADGERSHVVVSFVSEWSAAEFPGYSECEVTIADADGQELGTQIFKYASYRPEPNQITTDVEVSSNEAAASAKGASGYCSASTKPPATAGYNLAGLRVTSGGSVPSLYQEWDRPELTFTASWATDEPPMLQSCIASLILEDGTLRDFPFEISLGNGDEGHVLLPPVAARSTVKSVECSKFA